MAKRKRAPTRKNPVIELAKKLKGPSQLERVQAARAIIEAQRPGPHQERLAMYGFLSIFHPEMSHIDKHSLCRDAYP